MAAFVPSAIAVSAAIAVPAVMPEAETEIDAADDGRRIGIGCDYGGRRHDDGGWRHSDGRHAQTDTDIDARLGFGRAKHQSRGCQRQRTDTQGSLEPIHLEYHGLFPRMSSLHRLIADAA